MQGKLPTCCTVARVSMFKYLYALKTGRFKGAKAMPKH